MGLAKETIEDFIFNWEKHFNQILPPTPKSIFQCNIIGQIYS